MATLTNAVTTANSLGNREDLEDVIYRVAPEETPFISNIGTTKAAGIYHEWQTETLASASSTNAQAEGNVFTIAAGNLTTRVGNECQILTKTFGVSRTENVVKKAGRTSETNRQKLLKMIEARRDLEFSSLANNAAASSPRQMAGILAWLTTNTSTGSGGSNGGWSAAPGPAAATNGTQRTFTETLVKTVMNSAFTNGGKPSQAYMSPTDKQNFSAFTGIADIRVAAKPNEMAAIVGAADVYVSDFGNLQLIPHPYGLSRDCVFVTPEMAAMATLDGWQAVELAKTADADQYAILYEGTFVCRNEKAHGVVRDIL